MLTLIQSQAPWDATGLLLRLGVISVIAMVIGVVGWRLYRRAKTDAEKPTPVGGGLSLDALRAMYDRGELSEEEFKVARAAVLRAMGVPQDLAGCEAPQVQAQAPALAGDSDGQMDGQEEEQTDEPLPDAGDDVTENEEGQRP